MRETIPVLNKLVDRGVIKRYAIAGAWAALHYTQPRLTQDVDVLVSLDSFEQHSSGLITLLPLFEALKQEGYGEIAAEGVMVGAWPVEFLRVASKLDEEALDQAVAVVVQSALGPSLKTRILRAEHVVTTAVALGRPDKDFSRIHDFLRQKAVALDALKDVIERHSLHKAWKRACDKLEIPNPLGLNQ